MNNTDSKSSFQQRLSTDPLAAKKEADLAYTQLTTLTGNMLQHVQQYNPLTLEIIDDLQSKVMDMFYTFNPSLLMECLNVVRIDKDYYRYHSVNVALLSLLIARQFNTSEQELNALARVGLIHDLGMVRVSPRSLMEVGELTEHEKKLVRRHPEISLELIIKAGETNQEVLNGVAMHHERFDGSGYPQRLSGSEITRVAQIISIADIYDAALAKKLYRKQKSPFELIAELSANRDGSLNPDIVKIAAYGLAKLLVGRRVTMSDNSVGVVVRIDPQNLAYPIVRVVNNQFQSTPDLYPTGLSGYMPLFHS